MVGAPAAEMSGPEASDPGGGAPWGRGAAAEPGACGWAPVGRGPTGGAGLGVTHRDSWLLCARTIVLVEGPATLALLSCCSFVSHPKESTSFVRAFSRTCSS